MLRQLLDTEAAELDVTGREPQVLLDARLILGWDAVDGVDAPAPQASRPVMKSCCSNFSRDDFANRSACANPGSLSGGLSSPRDDRLFPPSLLDAEAGREAQPLLGRE